MKNPIIKILVYGLVIIGAMLMISPFIWMVMTSFKLDSEVESWPPQWISKSFSSNRDVRLSLVRSGGVTIDFSALTIEEFFNLNKIIQAQTKSQSPLVYTINDDAPYRGLMRIDFSADGNSIDYCTHMDDESIERLDTIFAQNEPLPANIRETYTNMAMIDVPTTMVNTLLNYLYYEHDSPLSRMEIVRSFQEIMQKVDEFVDKNGTKLIAHNSFIIQPSDESTVIKEKELMQRYTKQTIDTVQSKMGKFNLYLEEFKKGSPIMELNELNTLYSTAMEQFNAIELPENHSQWAALRLMEKYIITPLFAQINALELGTQVLEFYQALQTKTADINYITFKFRTNEQITQDILQALSNAPFSDENKTLLEKLIQNDLKNSANNLYKDLDKRFESELNEYKLTQKEKSIINSKIKSYCDQFSSILNNDTQLETLLLKELLAANDIDGMIASSTLSEQDKLDLTRQYHQAIEYLTSLSNDVTRATLLLGKRYESELFAQYYTSLYSDVFNRMEVIEAPEFVQAVNYRNLRSLEIKLDNVHPIWLWDETPKMTVQFSFTDVFKNIFQNYVNAWKMGKYFGNYYVNTIFVALTTTILDILFACMAAFAFSKLKFFGRDFIFMLFLATMMVPGEVLLVPNYITLSVFGWIDTYYALIIPWTVSAFVIFLIRQHFMSIPDELYDAGKMDGISKWGFLWKVMVPLSKPVIITGSLLKFIGSWNAFLWVLIVTKSPEVRTLPVGLANFSSEVGTLYNQLMAASTFSMLPIVILFLFVQKYFIQGIARTGLK